ncbi:MAG: choice-of-anchor D domain-containing protein, partial [Terracidiphilus sp.]
KTPTTMVRVAYRSTDGGATWASITSNLPSSAANGVVVDPQDANTVYIALDSGVFSTRQISSCVPAGSSCWSAYGTGLPEAPVVGLSAAPATASLNVLAAATYGRGVWQIPLWTAGAQLTTATVTPSQLTFASQAYGTSSNAQTVTLTNTGGIALTPGAIAASGDFSETDNCQNTVMNADANCTIEVTFTPTQAGGRTGQLTINANVAGGQLTAALSGTGEDGGAVALAPITLSFGTVEVGETSAALPVTVENSGSIAIPITSVNVTAPFVMSYNACGSSIAADGDCAVTVTFAPTQTGSATGTMTLVDGAGTQTAQLSGSGASAPTDTLSPASMSFSGTIAGDLSASQPATLTNSGGVPLTLIVTSVSGPFQVTSNCGAQLAANASCSIGVVFAPTAAGAQTGMLTVSDALRTQTVALSGAGLAPPAIGVSPSSLNFPAQQVGAASSPLALTVSNSGGSAMANVGFQITGPAAGSFTTGTTTCGATLNNGSSCTVQVIFTPTATGGNAATLTVSSSTLGVKAVAVALSGAGTAASGLNASPAQMAFTQATIGQASVAQTVTISNTSPVSAGGLSVVVTAPFSLTQNTCGASLAAGASCLAGVAFTPTENGTEAGTLTINSSTLNTASVALSGTGGLAGAVQLQPVSLNFPTTGVGMTSSAQNVTVTNTGTVPLSDLALTISSEFQLAGNTCTTTLGVGASCTAGVTFVPSVAGQQTGNLTVASSAMATNVQAPLSGMGADFTAALSGASSQTVASGQTATYTLALTPINGSAGTFTFQCSALPANAFCTFDPGSETVAANNAGSATVLIATGHSLSAGRTSGMPGWGAVPMVCGLLLFPLAWKRRRKVLLLFVAGILVIGGLSSCSGSGGGTGGTPPGGQGNSITPAGTYSIPVAVVSNGVSHTVTLSLTVD